MVLFNKAAERRLRRWRYKSAINDSDYETHQSSRSGKEPETAENSNGDVLNRQMALGSIFGGCIRKRLSSFVGTLAIEMLIREQATPFTAKATI
jgi:hypothetical protein